MSEQDNVKRIGQMYEAFGKGEIGYIVDQLADDVQWVSRVERTVPWSGEYTGKANVPKFFEAIGSSVDVTAFTPGEFVALGDTVVSRGEFGFRVKASGKTALTPWIFIWKFRDGKVASYEQFNDPAMAEAFR